VASIGRRGWRQVKTSLAGEVEVRVAPPLAELVARVSQLQDATADIAGSLAVLRRELAELADVVTVQVDVGNQTTELFGRLLATASNRLEVVEDSLRQLAGGSLDPPNGSNGSTESRSRIEAAVSPASEDPAKR